MFVILNVKAFTQFLLIRKKILFLFEDYPKNFTPEEKALFDKENPYWANFFRGRTATPSKKSGAKKTKKK